MILWTRFAKMDHRRRGARQRRSFRGFVGSPTRSSSLPRDPQGGPIGQLTARRSTRPEWQRIVDGPLDLGEVEIKRDVRRAHLVRATDPICRALGMVLLPVYEEVPPLG
jgi:hypothetical protein